MFWQLRKLVTRLQSGSKLTTALSADPLPPTPSASSTVMTCDPQSIDTLALLIEIEGTTEKNRKGP